MKDIKYCFLLFLTNLCLIFVICKLETVIKISVSGFDVVSESMAEFDQMEEDKVQSKVYLENQEATVLVDEKKEGIATVASNQKVLYYDTLMEMIAVSEKDYEILLKIVEAEAGGEDYEGKQLVANVILNRVESEDFPDSVSEVVYQQSGGVTQFQPVSNGTIDQVVVSDETKEAVDEVLLGEDISEGALYFASRKTADPERIKWFDEHLTFLFSHGGHEFFR